MVYIDICLFKAASKSDSPISGQYCVDDLLRVVWNEMMVCRTNARTVAAADFGSRPSDRINVPS